MIDYSGPTWIIQNNLPISPSLITSAHSLLSTTGLRDMIQMSSVRSLFFLPNGIKEELRKSHQEGSYAEGMNESWW
jgi:hypothetical protein